MLDIYIYISAHTHAEFYKFIYNTRTIYNTKYPVPIFDIFALSISARARTPRFHPPVVSARKAKNSNPLHCYITICSRWDMATQHAGEWNGDGGRHTDSGARFSEPCKFFCVTPWKVESGWKTRWKTYEYFNYTIAYMCVRIRVRYRILHGTWRVRQKADRRGSQSIYNTQGKIALFSSMRRDTATSHQRSYSVTVDPTY